MVSSVSFSPYHDHVLLGTFIPLHTLEWDEIVRMDVTPTRRWTLVPTPSATEPLSRNQVIVMQMLQEVEVGANFGDSVMIVSDMVTDMLHPITEVRVAVTAVLTSIEYEVITEPADTFDR